jgi:hypothetical protein
VSPKRSTQSLRRRFRWLARQGAVLPLQDGVGPGKGREDGEEVLDCMAGVVGTSRCEFVRRAVAVGDGNRRYAIPAGSFDIEVAVPDHERGGGIEGLLFEQTTQQGRLGMIKRSDGVRVYSKEVGFQGELFEDSQGEVFALGGADEELPARGLEALQHSMDSGIDGVFLPTGGVVTGAVVVQESGTTRLVGVWHEAAQGLAGGRSDEPVQGAGPWDPMGVEGAGEAPENAGFRVSERAVKIEYGGLTNDHVFSIARGQGGREVVDFLLTE